MKLLRDTWLLFVSYVRETLRNPVWVLISLFTPIMYLVLFAPLLDGLVGSPSFSGSNALSIFTPGALVMLGLFGSLFVGFSIISDLRAGVVERLRVTTVSRLAPLLARALRDGLMLMVQAIVFMLIAWPLGLKADFLGVVIVLALVVIMGMTLAACSYALGLILKSEDAMAPVVNIFTTPLLLLSGILLPMALAPEWLRTIANFSPFTHVVNAARALFAGNYGDNSVYLAIGIMGTLSVLAMIWAGRVFQKATS